MSTGFVGASVKRLEDEALLTGKGRYIDDLDMPGLLEAAFVRSPHPHACIVSIDTAAACNLPGVRAVFTQADLSAVLTSNVIPSDHRIRDFPETSQPLVMVADEACYVGEPVAVVIADSRYTAEGAAALVDVEYEPLPSVSDCREALAPGAPTAHRAARDNIVKEIRTEYGDCDAAFAAATHVHSVSLKQHRGGAHSIEPRGILARPEAGSDQVTVWISTQAPHRIRNQLVELLGTDEHRVRVIVPDVGGGFGGKNILRIGRTKRRLRWLREYRSGRCGVRNRYESRRIAVGMVRFRAGKQEGMPGRRWRAKGTGGEAQRSCGAPADGRGQDRAGDGEAGGWACGAWSGGARGGLMPPVSRAARWVRMVSMSERARVASGTSRGVSMHAQRAATYPTVFDVDVEDALEPLHPIHGSPTRRMRLTGGWVSGVGDDAVAVLAVRCEHAVVSGEMGAGTRHEGGEAGDEVDGVEHDMSRPVPESVLESIHDLPAVIDRETFVRQRGAGDVAAQAFEGVPFMGFAAGMEGEPREPGDAGVVGRRAGVDGAQRQGVSPGVGAGGDAVVDGGAEELLEIVGGLDVEGGGLFIAQQQSLLFQGAGDTGGDGVEQALEFGLGLGAATPDGAATPALPVHR